jgi:hypothetical protein
MPGNQGILFAAVMLSVTAQKEKRRQEKIRRTFRGGFSGIPLGEQSVLDLGGHKCRKQVFDRHRIQVVCNKQLTITAP